MELVLITGMSGAGKATAAKGLEELGFMVIDNLPPSLIPGLVREISSAQVSDRVCIVTDARSGSLFHDFPDVVKHLQSEEPTSKILFIDATNTALVSRFSETRRHHPYGTDDRGVLAGIEHERSLVEEAKCLADFVVDSSDLKTDQLQQAVRSAISKGLAAQNAFTVGLTSFGFKFGLPLDADLVFDVRFLANPYYQESLRDLDGRDERIDTFVLNDPAALPYLQKILDLLDFSLPRYVTEGKAFLTIAIGCTGGRHRSVVLSERVAHRLRELGYRTLLTHRDIAK